ncbi:MAG: hypothetical protein KDB37_06675 [Ilumatobacter sp.]|nr:hypothetical protein [Ilumatobacter sp.]
MGLFDNLRKTIAVARGGEVDPNDLSPEQRALYEEQQARVAAAKADLTAARRTLQASIDEQALERPLRGPAAEIAYGPRPEVADHTVSVEAFEQGGVGGLLRHEWSRVRTQLGGTARTMATGAPRGVDDPVERRRIETTERHDRDRRRADYTAPGHAGVTVTRIATRGSTQLDDVVAYLVDSGLAARPDLVYGVSRVPDRISPAKTPTSERRRVVEWEVIHEPNAGLAPGGSVERATLSAWDHWVRRSKGDPAVVDEELGVALLELAGLRADRCLGVARAVAMRSVGGGDEGSGEMVGCVEGVHVLAAAPVAAAIDGLIEAAPVDLPVHGRDGAFVEVLGWSDVASVVHPQPQRTHVIPSPCPYLPSTPQELLVMYLEVVGVRAADCYSAEVTIDGTFELVGVGRYGLGGSNSGGEEMCADGEVRRRLRGATHVVIAYDDRPEYEAGRERWRRYQDEVLQTQLELQTGARRPILPAGSAGLENPLMRSAARAVEAFETLLMYGETQVPPDFRYCQPLE